MRKEKTQKIFLICIVAILLVALIVLSVALGMSNSANSSLKEQNAVLRQENSELESEILTLSAAKQEASLNSAPVATPPESSKPDLTPPESSEPAPSAPPQIQAPIEPNSKVCYLTFDDGPSNNTLTILDVLARYDAKATFFVVGTARLDYLDEIHNAGHTVGLHTNTHVFSSVYSSDDAYFADLSAISAAVEQRIGVKSMCVRFPGGGSNTQSKKYNIGIMSRLAAELPGRGYAYFDWNVDSGDAKSNNVPAETIYANVIAQAQNKNSICVLMHDTSTKATTAQALPAIIEGLRSMGFRFEALNPSCYGYHHQINN